MRGAEAWCFPCWCHQAPCVISSLPTCRELQVSHRTRQQGGPLLAAVTQLCHVVASRVWPCARCDHYSTPPPTRGALHTPLLPLLHYSKGQTERQHAIHANQKGLSWLQPLATALLWLMLHGAGQEELFCDTIKVPSSVKQTGGPGAIFWFSSHSPGRLMVICRRVGTAAMVAQPSFFVQSVGAACPMSASHTVVQAVIVFLSVSLPQEADSKINAPAHSQFLILNVASMVVSTLGSCTAAIKFTVSVHHILTLVCLT